MAHDVFISYSSKDKAAADAVVAGLEQKGIRCWVAPRDLTPGISWGKGISDAIEASEVMVVILSENSNQSKQVAREVERAVSKEVAVIPFRIENFDPTGEMAYFLASEHWLDAINPPLERHIDKLGNVIKLFLAENGDESISDSIIQPTPKEIPEEPPKEKPWWQKGSTIGVVIGFGVLIFLCIGLILLSVFVILPRLQETPASPAAPSPSATETIVLAELAATATPTQLPPLPTLSPTTTPTIEPSLTPTSTLPSGNLSLPEGWIEYNTEEFAIGLPASWEVVDIDEEGMQALLDLLSDYDPDWAEMLESTMTGDAAAPPILFAMGTERVGMGYPNVNISKETLPIPFPMGDLCAELDSLYTQMGVDIVSSDCDLKINGMDAAKYNLGVRVGGISTQQYQYIYKDNTTIYFASLSVDQNGWSEYQATFEQIAQTFTITGSN